MRVLLRLALLGLVIATARPPCALADPPAPARDPAAVKLAKQYVAAGLAAQDAHDYDTAIALYSRAYQLVPHPLLIFNLAQAHRLAGHLDKALVLYRRYLAEDPDGAQATIARGFVAELAEREAARRRAFEAAARSSDAAGQRSDPPAAPAAPAVPPAAPGGAPVDRSPAASPGRAAWTWALVGSAVTTAGGGLFTLYAHDRLNSWVRDIPPGLTDSDCGRSAASLRLSPDEAHNFDRACSWRTRSVVGFWLSGAALVAMVVSLVMVTREPGAPEPATAGPGKHEVAIAPIIAPGAGGRVALGDLVAQLAGSGAGAGRPARAPRAIVSANPAATRQSRPDDTNA